MLNEKVNIFYIFIIPLTVNWAEDSHHLQEAMDSFQLEPGLRIELFAAEPLVVITVMGGVAPSDYCRNRE